MNRNRLLSIIAMIMLALLIPHISTAETTVPYLDEPYSIRGGIRFGMSIEEVSVVEAKSQTATPNVRELGAYGEMKNVTTMGYQVPSLVGIEVSSLITGEIPESLSYTFDSDGHLFEISYWFGPTASNSKAQEIISKLNTLLTQKYGKALHASDGEVFPLFSASLYDQMLLGTNITLNQWLVEYEDCYVVIDNYYDQYSNYTSIHLAQRMLEKVDVELVLKAQKSQSDDYAQQEQNDI